MVVLVLKWTLYVIGILFGLNLSIGLISIAVHYIRYRILLFKQYSLRITFDPLVKKLDNGLVQMEMFIERR